MAGLSPVRHHGVQMARLFAGERDPDGPGEVFDLMKRERRHFPEDKAEEFKRQWVADDMGIHRNWQDSSQLKGDLPPCHKCSAQIVTFCYVTDTMCDKFKGWTEEGKTRSFLDMKSLQNTA